MTGTEHEATNMTDQRHALLEAFIRSDVSPDGKWWVDVPVGVSVGDKGEDKDEDEGGGGGGGDGRGDHAVLDAVCLTSREAELPEVYPDHTGVAYATHRGDEAAGVTKADSFRALRERDVFTDERAVLVAVEPGASAVGTVGDLLAYRELLRVDWDWTVEELLLVSDEDSGHVNYVCSQLGVRAIRVA